MADAERAVIFDMDGVIVNSEPRHEKAFFQVVEQVGFGGRHGMRFADYIGRSDNELWLDFVALNRPPQRLEELVAMKRARMVEIIRRERPIFDGLLELLVALSTGRAVLPFGTGNDRFGVRPAPSSGPYRLGLASGSERAIVDEVLKLNGLAGFFTATVSASEIERGKPAPDIFLKTAGLLGVEPSACWVVEDSKPGITAGLAAGMKVIAITNTHAAGELGAAHYVVSSYLEIAVILGINQKAP